MTKKVSATVCSSLLGVMVTATAAEPITSQETTLRPNIVLIMADDLGYETVGVNGALPPYRTPHLDALAGSGMRFTQCHVQPLCTPSRVQMMTGQSNVRNYVNFGELKTGEKTFGNLLKDAGYATAIAGKWQLGGEKDAPQKFGFDESFLWQQLRNVPRYANPGFEVNGEPRDFTQGEFGPDLVNDFALNFISRHRHKPFFLYYTMIEPHGPYDPTPDCKDWDPKQTTSGGYDAEGYPPLVAYADKMVGRLVAKLDELGLRENTLVIFLGDNGTPRHVTSIFEGKNYPGGKAGTTARGTHVPLIASWPGRIASGSVSKNLISSTDFFATVADVAGVSIPEPAATDGLSFLPVLFGKSDAPVRESIYFWYLQRKPSQVIQWAQSATHKLYGDGRFYDLQADPFEDKPALAVNPSDPAVVKLQAVLDSYSHARPTHLAKAAKDTPKE